MDVPASAGRMMKRQGDAIKTILRSQLQMAGAKPGHHQRTSLKHVDKAVQPRVRVNDVVIARSASDEAIQTSFPALDCFALLAMTARDAPPCLDQ
jgi:hypothetical protein